MAESAPVVVIGAGPAGLMAAEVIATAGFGVTVYDRMPSIGRKLLMAGRGGLNLTHSEPFACLVERYGAATCALHRALTGFPPAALRAWAESLGQPTFVGTSGRVFPVALKASPLLRAWAHRLTALGVRFVLRRRWLGWNDADDLVFAGPAGQEAPVRPAATVLALGGASWPRLGSDGAWVPLLVGRRVAVAPLRPANCGFVVPWSAYFGERFAGQPLKPVTVRCGGFSRQGEIMITGRGVEGSVIYALSAVLRDTIAAVGAATLTIDLRPGLTVAELGRRLAEPRGSRSLSTVLRKAAGLTPAAIGVLREVNQVALDAAPEALAALIKALPLRLTATGPLERAISTAGGITFDDLDEWLMVRHLPGVFAAGEMLDWEGPTGGYLLQGSFSTAVRAAQGVTAWLRAGH